MKIRPDRCRLNFVCIILPDKGNSPLHYAARAKSSEAVSLLLRSGSYIGHRNILGVPPLAHISPETLSEFFDDCLRSDKDRTEEYEIEFDYRCLMPHNINCRGRDEAQEESRMTETDQDNAGDVNSEMEALVYIAENRALKPLLMHPLISSFLYLKWHRIRHILYVNFVFYVIFWALINLYIISTNNYGSNPRAVSASGNSSDYTSTMNFQKLGDLRSLTAIVLIFLGIRESFQLISSPWYYVSSFENILEVALIVLGVWVIATGNRQVGAVVILLSAWELVILIGQHPRMSTGIEMFKKVSVNFIRFLFLYAFLIISFALAFYILFNDSKRDDNFPDPGQSLFKTIIMLTGEFDANDIPFDLHPVLSHCIFVLFVFLIAIVLFNLLNGLAVSDTADILNKSELVSLISRTKLVCYVERVAVGSGIVKLTGCCCSERSVRRSNFNPLTFLSKRILLFPDYLPQGTLGVKPYNGNSIRFYGRATRTRGCANWSMDPSIVGRAGEILSRKNEITDNQRMIVELDTIKRNMDRFERILDDVRQALKNNNVNSTNRD